MAEKTIDDLAAAVGANLTDLLIARQTGVDNKLTEEQLEQFVLRHDECFIFSAFTLAQILASSKSTVGNDFTSVLNSLRTKTSSSPYRTAGGYSAVGIAVPTEVITTPAAPIDGRTMVSGGAYTGPPYGTDPVYEIVIVTVTTFKWRQLINAVETIPFSAPIAITGAAQPMHEGVTVEFSTAVGWTAGAWSITIDDDEMTANRTWELQADTGNALCTGTFTGSHTFTDYAELFENFTEGNIIPIGTIVALAGRKIFDGNHVKDNQEPLGIITGAPHSLAGDTPFAWQGRFLRDKFNQLLRDADGNPLVNPDYDPTIKNIPRSERPAEWSKVGLLGQLPTRVGKEVKPDDYVNVAGNSFEPPPHHKTTIRCLEITEPYDADEGCAVALCLIR